MRPRRLRARPPPRPPPPPPPPGQHPPRPHPCLRPHCCPHQHPAPWLCTCWPLAATSVVEVWVWGAQVLVVVAVGLCHTTVDVAVAAAAAVDVILVADMTAADMTAAAAAAVVLAAGVADVTVVVVDGGDGGGGCGGGGGLRLPHTDQTGASVWVAVLILPQVTVRGLGWLHGLHGEGTGVRPPHPVPHARCQQAAAQGGQGLAVAGRPMAFGPWGGCPCWLVRWGGTGVDRDATARAVWLVRAHQVQSESVCVQA